MNQVCELFGIRYPIVQGGMVWVSGAKLAAAVSEAGGLGLVGAGSMKPEELRFHLEKARRLTGKPYGVNIPIFSPYSEDQVRVALEMDVPIFFLSAGSPRRFTGRLKEAGRTVVHVTSTPSLALKCQDAGVDAVVVEGFEAGGHNGREELTTMVLVPMTRDAVHIPVIAAGGIADGRGIAAAMMLGADGVQIGTRFAVTVESSAADAYKRRIVEAGDAETALLMKRHIPVRLVSNQLTDRIQELENAGADAGQLAKLVSGGAARKGIFEGDVAHGEVEAGQVTGMIRDIPTVRELVPRLVRETREAIGTIDGSGSRFAPFLDA